MADTAPPFNFKEAITEMAKQNASDLHLKVGRPPTIRVAGDLRRPSG
jgi:Tfp pilus assembly pilus retraction ATPase PilT